MGPGQASSNYHQQTGVYFVDTPYGTGQLVGIRGNFVQVRLRWGGLMSIQRDKCMPHSSHTEDVAAQPQNLPCRKRADDHDIDMEVQYKRTRC